jgi:2-polyprenyl-3-methyl-5-hydroxy-6-metoxy-1,4-benzoquinol methylase
LKTSAHIASTYEAAYAGGESEWRRIGAIEKANNIIALCRGCRIESVVEIGAGEGSVIERLASLNFAKSFHACEISQAAVHTIKGRSIDRLADCVLFDGYRTPFDDKRFDLAIMTHVIEHVEHPRVLLYEAMRVARLVFVEVPLEHTVRLPRDFRFTHIGHINFYTETTIRALLQSCGLRIIGQKTTNSSKGTHSFHKSATGSAKYYIKAAGLALAPSLAKALFVYNSSLLCESRNSV